MFGQTESDGSQNCQKPDYPEDKLKAITSVKIFQQVLYMLQQ